MTETEDQLFARIAKHNGTTVEEERARAGRVIEVDSTASVHAHVGTPQIPAVHTDSNNGAWTALTVITGIGVLIGFILLGVGLANGAAFDPSEFSEHTDNGVIETVLGSFLSGIGLTSGLLMLCAAAVMRHIDLRK